MKTIIIGFLLICVPLTAFPKPGDQLVVNGNNVNLRIGPSLNSPVIKKLKKGHLLLELSRKGKWIEVSAESGEKLGWIHSSLTRWTGNSLYNNKGQLVSINYTKQREIYYFYKVSYYVAKSEIRDSEPYSPKDANQYAIEIVQKGYDIDNQQLNNIIEEGNRKGWSWLINRSIVTLSVRAKRNQQMPTFSEIQSYYSKLISTREIPVTNVIPIGAEWSFLEEIYAEYPTTSQRKIDFGAYLLNLSNSLINERLKQLTGKFDSVERIKASVSPEVFAKVQEQFEVAILLLNYGINLTDGPIQQWDFGRCKIIRNHSELLNRTSLELRWISLAVRAKYANLPDPGELKLVFVPCR